MHFLPEIIYIDEGRKTEIQEFLDEWFDTAETVQANSSGSTGSPKKIVLQKKYMIASAKNTIAYFELLPGQSIYLCLSTATIAGKMMLVRAIVGQLKIVIGPVSSDSLLHCALPIDFTAIVPLQLEQALKVDPKRLNTFGKVLVGGAPLSDQLMNKIIAAKLSIYQSYGMTETMSHVAIRNINEFNTLTYKALNNITFSLNLSEELIIHAPELGLPELKTNDIVDLHSPTSFTWLGRSDFIINSGGKKISPERIEKKLSQLIDLPFYIYGIPDQTLGSKAVLIVESSTEFSLDKTKLTQLLEKHELPKAIIRIEQFIRTESNKIDRHLTYLRPHVAETVF
jgi:o-succinylbenzoate---CoA ligase